MRRVTIEGTFMPSVYLARGERRTVTVTEDIRNLVKIGAAVVVAGSLDPEAVDDGEVAATENDDPSGDTPPPTEDSAPSTDERTDTEREADAQAEGDGPDPDGVPAKNASRERWAKFLRSNGVAFPDGDEAKGEQWAGRDDLIIIWQQASGGS